MMDSRNILAVKLSLIFTILNMYFYCGNPCSSDTRNRSVIGSEDKITNSCGPKVYAFVFDKNDVLSQECSGRLMHARGKCHNSLTNSILSEEGFSREQTEKILTKHDEAWNLCKRHRNIGTSIPSAAQVVQPLPGCTSKVTSACGPKVYAFVLDKSGVLSQECCGRLLCVARDYHNSLPNSILSEGEFPREEIEEKVARHDKAWNLCKRSGHIGTFGPAAILIIQHLPGCGGKISSCCGPNVYAFVFDKSRVVKV